MKPSDDYAGLVKELRPINHDIHPLSINGTIMRKAADALEALLAERDDFAEQLALRSESGMAKDMQEIMRINNELVAERDALAARLAPVEDDKLVAILVKHIIDATSDMPPRTTYSISERSLAGARAAIAAIRPHIEAAERERCAKAVKTVAKKINVAPHERPAYEDGYLQGVHDAAAAIRSGSVK